MAVEHPQERLGRAGSDTPSFMTVVCRWKRPARTCSNGLPGDPVAPALRDLGEIARYIATDNPAAAENVGLGLIQLAESLATMPGRGGALRSPERSAS